MSQRTPEPQPGAALEREALELFEELMELDPLARDRRLEWLARNRPELEAEVRGLLAAQAQPSVLPATLDLGSLRSSGIAPGARIGAYRVVSELGRGGMGRVYLAERADGAFEQRVAIKAMRGFLGVDLRPRFERERRILARLDHPAIARILDGGATDAGEPYLVMELVEGAPIDRWCDERRLAIDERLRLFCAVCDAVQHAHAHLIVHRDLKPSNILVTPEGRPKLLDFGIAKLLAGNDEEGATLTVAAARPLTPEYASPEQITGGSVTTASDVYSLGVLLYVLLAGKHPYAEPDATPRQLEEAAIAGVATAPSTAAARGADLAGEIAARRSVDARGLRQRLRGDLDCIVLQSLRKEPERRYASAAQLAADIERHLSGQPVAAHPDSRLYRAGRFLARHRLAVAAATVVLASLLGGLLFSVRQARIAERERHKAERIAAVLQDMLAAPDASYGAGGMSPDVKVVEVLEAARAKLDSVAEDPEVEAALRRTLGRTFAVVGRLEPARRELERAAALYTSLRGPGHEDTLLASYYLAIALMHGSQWAEGEAVLREVLEACATRACTADLEIGSLNYLSAALRIQGKLEEAADALAQAQARLPPDHPLTAGLLANLGELELVRARPEAARRALASALEAYGRLDVRKPIEELVATSTLAWLENMSGNFAASEALYRRAVELGARHLAPNNSSHFDARLGWAMSLVEIGDIAGARREGQAAIDATRTTMAGQHEVLWSARRAAWGQVLCMSGDPQTGRREIERALELLSGQGPAQQWRSGEAQARLGRCLLAQGSHREAAAELEAAVRRLEGLLEEGDPRLIMPRRWLEEARSAGASS
jgi:serine/threonine-protein kinase